MPDPLVPTGSCMEFRTKGHHVKNGKPATIQNAVSVLLSQEQTMCLDQIASPLRRNSGHSISRCAIVRALCRSALQYLVEWLHCESEEELFHEVSGRLMRGKG